MNCHIVKSLFTQERIKQKLFARQLRLTFPQILVLFIGLHLFSVNAVGSEKNVTKTRHGLLIGLGEAKVELAAATPYSLRLSVYYQNQTQPIQSSFLVDSDSAKSVAWSICHEGEFVGVKTKAGRLLMNPVDGAWTLESASGETLIPKHKIGKLNQYASTTNSQIDIQLGWNEQKPIEAYGCGNGVTDLLQTNANAHVSNGKAVLPYYWSKAGYSVLAVTTDDNQPASWHGATNVESKYVTWTFPGSRADLYLMPAASLKDATEVYASLTGAAPVPPRWVFGYLQSRWGWTNRAYIEDTMKHFTELNIPVDAFIYDFEWYTHKPDYKVPNAGETDFEDFGWNTDLFPDPVNQIKDYKAQGVHFVGIRKPRLGNSNLLKMIRAKGWDLQSHLKRHVPARNLDFASPALRDWYIKQIAGLLKNGVDGWWNDEGEFTYTTYFYWNLTERTALNRYRPGGRLWTLNRAFSPGTQRFGAAVWTGDVASKWKVLAETPANLLNWGLCGMPYGACDIGGFAGSPSPEMLSRWMEAGVFFPIMRTHSEIYYQPHFPWLYGTNALEAMRKAIDLRYRLIPYYYSLAYKTFETGVPLMRPLAMEFPNDPTVANLSDEWLMGESILAAPILEKGGKRSVYLPAGDWYVFGTNDVLKGSRSIEVTAALDEIPTYVLAGTILPLGPVIQHTSETPGGPLELQIYPGRDATFTLVEDDGITQNYLKGETRRTVFTWDDGKKQLKWNREGNYSGNNVFKSMRVVVFDPHGNSAAKCSLTSSGEIEPKPQLAM